MAFEDYLEPEIAVTAAVTAVVFSASGRKFLRRGAVYGLTGILVAGDAIASAARSVGQGVKSASASATQATSNVMQQAKAGATSAESSVAQTTHNATEQARAGAAQASASEASSKNASRKSVVDPTKTSTEGQAL